MAEDRIVDTDLYEKLRKLTEPFPPEEINLLPKPVKRRGAPGYEDGNCPDCGRWHGLPAVHIDYVGHANLTRRLLQEDPLWNWRPLALTPEGAPLMDHHDDGTPAGMWIVLTIHGLERLGYGSVDPGANDPVKQIIGDALRNAGMRFGLALDLWMKDREGGGDLTYSSGPRRQQQQPRREQGPAPRAAAPTPPQAVPRARTRGDIWGDARGQNIRPSDVQKQAGRDPKDLSDAELEAAIADIVYARGQQ